MGHWAQIDETNHVIKVIVADDDMGDWLTNTLGGQWLSTSYNTYGGIHYDPITGEPSGNQSKALRMNFAAVGYYYDGNRDAFIAPRPPGDGWILDEISCLWVRVES